MIVAVPFCTCSEVMKKTGMRRRGFARPGRGAAHSKNVFILSKNPSPSVSVDIPLSFANSPNNSFCLGDSLVGIWILILIR